MITSMSQRRYFRIAKYTATGILQQASQMGNAIPASHDPEAPLSHILDLSLPELR